MSNFFNELQGFLIKNGLPEQRVVKKGSTPNDTAQQIAIYALRNCTMPNGNSYVHHFNNLLNMYWDVFGIILSKPETVNLPLIKDTHGLPYEGVQELLALKDILDVSEYKLDDIKEVFSETGNLDFFNKYLKDQLCALSFKWALGVPQVHLSTVLSDKTVAFVMWFDLTMRIQELTSPPSTNAKTFQLDMLEAIQNKYDFRTRVTEYINDLRSKK